MVTKKELLEEAQKLKEEEKQVLKEIRRYQFWLKLRDAEYWFIPIWIVWAFVVVLILVFLDMVVEVELLLNPNQRKLESPIQVIQLIIIILSFGMSVFLTYHTIKYLKMRREAKEE